MLVSCVVREQPNTAYVRCVVVVRDPLVPDNNVTRSTYAYDVVRACVRYVRCNPDELSASDRVCIPLCLPSASQFDACR
jgi:hypothetical protein